MKFMKLGTRPDTFFTVEAVRTISSEVSTDIKIQVQNSLFVLHKFPLLSKCSRLQKLCSGSKNSSDDTIFRLPHFPGGSDSFEICAKFCYGITITLSALNIVPVRCAAEYLGMTDEIDKGNLIGKLEAFFKSIVLRRWKDTLITLNATREHSENAERLQITSRCIDAIGTIVAANPSKLSWPKSWWAKDISELETDIYWRIMLAIKSSGRVPDKIIGEALKIYACKWLTDIAGDDRQDISPKNKLILERIVCLLPMDKGSVNCGFLLWLLKAANIYSASNSCKIELARRIGIQLDEATVQDLLIMSTHDQDETLYDVDIVMSILDEFMLQGQSPETSPQRDKLKCERRRSRSAENVDLEAMENRRRSSSASHSAKLTVAKLIDGYLLEVARDPNLPLDKLIAIAEAVPEFARPDHDDLYRVIDTYLKAHPDLDKSARKQLCRILDCKKLSIDACVHAAQNELLPLRVVLQVLFFEQARAAQSGSLVAELPSNLKALLAKTAGRQGREAPKFKDITRKPQINDDWSVSGVNAHPPKLQTLKMRLAEADNDPEEDVIIHHGALGRSGSSRFRSLCSISNTPKRIISKLWMMNRSVSERQ